jgi:LPS sulfotransferase NodH
VADPAERQAHPNADKPDAVPILTGVRRDARSYIASLLPRNHIGRLCVVATPRTGSTLLVQLLDAHPLIRCEGETLATWRDLPYRFVLGRSKMAARQGFKAYGFKMMSDQLAYFLPRPRRFLHRLAADGFVFVQLRRKNLLRQAISYLLAQKRSEWHRYAPAEASPSRVIVDVTALIFWMAYFELHDAVCANVLDGLVTHDLYYEDHLETRELSQTTVDELCASVRVDPSPIDAPMMKLASRRIEDDIANLEDVVKTLSSTRYARFLDEL